MTTIVSMKGVPERTCRACGGALFLTALHFPSGAGAWTCLRCREEFEIAPTAPAPNKRNAPCRGGSNGSRTCTTTPDGGPMFDFEFSREPYESFPGWWVLYFRNGAMMDYLTC